MQTTTKKLNMTAEQYESMLFSSYAQWCESVTINDREFQKVLANAAVSSWFMMEYSKCEHEFHMLTDRYEGSSTVSTDDLKVCYIDCTDKMFNIRPTALLEQIKKSLTVGHLKIHGIKIPLATFNQN